ncbi:MAG TPA: TIGR03617 family F420-dependent LLM class oxidoreductase, partial [Acidimicrobiia bacterium]|nr:TIGR03617 family F420-dependent LLM class oxidoreductase [Acidimicrobiia bacterium]
PGPLAGVAHEARKAARLGFDGVMAAETSHDPFLALTAAAGAVPGMELGTAVAVAFARSPMTVAHAAWDLADMTGGRFLLGLGTQIRAHVVGRFSMPWSAPVPRMREFIAALRAIWSSWQGGQPLRFRGDHYRLSLMTPFFDPGPIDHPDVPVLLAAVGPAMCRLAGEVADGIHLHPFHTRRYLDEVIAPAIVEGAGRSGRRPEAVTRVATLFVVTGHDEEEMRRSKADARRRIAFYASTPAYRSILDLHGWDVGEDLNAMSKQGRWEEMAGLVDDEMLATVAVVAPPERLAEAIRRRCEDVVDRLGLMTGDALDEEETAELVGGLSG